MHRPMEQSPRFDTGDRVTRPVFMDDGTWDIEGDVCLARSPLRHGVIWKRWLSPVNGWLFSVKWDDTARMAAPILTTDSTQSGTTRKGEGDELVGVDAGYRRRRRIHRARFDSPSLSRVRQPRRDLFGFLHAG